MERAATCPEYVMGISSYEYLASEVIASDYRPQRLLGGESNHMTCPGCPGPPFLPLLSPPLPDITFLRVPTYVPNCSCLFFLAFQLIHLSFDTRRSCVQTVLNGGTIPGTFLFAKHWFQHWHWNASSGKQKWSLETMCSLPRLKIQNHGRRSI